jgi:hypothetical protein
VPQARGGRQGRQEKAFGIRILRIVRIKDLRQILRQAQNRSPSGGIGFKKISPTDR